MHCVPLQRCRYASKLSQIYRQSNGGCWKSSALGSWRILQAVVSRWAGISTAAGSRFHDCNLLAFESTLNAFQKPGSIGMNGNWNVACMQNRVMKEIKAWSRAMLMKGHPDMSCCVRDLLLTLFNQGGWHVCFSFAWRGQNLGWRGGWRRDTRPRRSRACVCEKSQDRDRILWLNYKMRERFWYPETPVS